MYHRQMGRLTELTEGMTFAGFRVERKLSEGGMGAVYVVTQLATGRQRALKLMHPELVENAGLREKFMQEARIGARIESEHVVDVVGAGVDEVSGVPWLAMELLRGEDLGALLTRRGRLELPEVLEIVEQLGHGMGAAHAAGIVHRDLKPENVFLAQTQRSDDAYTVKVLDFGIAKLMEEARTSSNTGTVGSAFWMAPEQTERRAVIAPSTDVWALALIVYRLLTGRYFWLTAQEEGSSVTAFLRELVLEPIPDARVRATQQGVAELLPPGFEDWFARGVVRDPAARFADARVATSAFCTQFGGARPAPSVASASTIVDHSREPRISTDIGTARTIPGDAPSPSAPSHAEEELDALPTHGSGRTAFIAIATLLVLGVVGGIAWRTPPVASTSGVTPPPIQIPAEVRCPSDMVPIAGGTFSMGSDDGKAEEKPTHRVAVEAFCVDVTEVTAQAYASCAAAKACPPPSDTVDWPGIAPAEKLRLSVGCNAGHADRTEHPINCVTWSAADAFCTWSKKRLPTEDEWEYVARGSEARIYPWGSEPPSAQRLNGCGDECAHGRAALLEDRVYQPLYPGSDGWESTAPVRSFGAGKTPTGVYDLAGNVWEWTASAYCPYSERSCTNIARVTRGGAWNSDAHEGVRSATRDKNTPQARAADVGFRCAL